MPPLHYALCGCEDLPGSREPGAGSERVLRTARAGAMPIGVNTWVWVSPLDDEALARLAPGSPRGASTCIELPSSSPATGTRSAPRRPAGRARAGRRGVCAVMPPGRELVAAAPETVVDIQDYLRHCVDVRGGRRRPGASAARRTPPSAVRGGCRRRARGGVLRRFRRGSGPGRRARGRARGEHRRRAAQPLRDQPDQHRRADHRADRRAARERRHHDRHLPHEHRGGRPRRGPARRRPASITHVQVCGTDRGAPGADHFDWPALLRRPCATPATRGRSASSRSPRRTRPSPPRPPSGGPSREARTRSPWTALPTCAPSDQGSDSFGEPAAAGRESFILIE